MTQWVWDEAKAAINRSKHRVSFESGVLALGDPLNVSRPDVHPDGDRVQTIGRAASGGPLLLVVHTEPEMWKGMPIGRIISVRKADRKERRLYEELEF